MGRVDPLDLAGIVVREVRIFFCVAFFPLVFCGVRLCLGEIGDNLWTSKMQASSSIRSDLSAHVPGIWCALTPVLWLLDLSLARPVAAR